MVERYRRAPDEVDETATASDEFLAYACLRHAGTTRLKDGNERLGCCPFIPS